MYAKCLHAKILHFSSLQNVCPSVPLMFLKFKKIEREEFGFAPLLTFFIVHNLCMNVIHTKRLLYHQRSFFFSLCALDITDEGYCKSTWNVWWFLLYTLWLVDTWFFRFSEASVTYQFQKRWNLCEVHILAPHIVWQDRYINVTVIYCTNSDRQSMILHIPVYPVRHHACFEWINPVQWPELLCVFL